MIQTAHFLREQQAGGGSGRQQLNMRKIIPPALNRFQTTLDDLESEVRQAQAVLRRDLALLQADRVKREQAEAAERERLAAATAVKPDAGSVAAKVSTSREPESLKREPSPGPSEITAPAPNGPGTTAATTAVAGEQNKDSTTPKEQSPAEAAAVKTENDNDIDFDDIFNDAGDEGESKTEAQNDVKMENAPSGDTTFHPDDQQGPSLLRGLEDFAKDVNDHAADNAGGNLDMDFTMPDLPDLPTSQPSDSGNIPIATTEASTAQQAQGSGTNDEMMQTMNTADLDDLFNMDDYDNPENSEFNDAFFGFGDN